MNIVSAVRTVDSSTIAVSLDGGTIIFVPDNLNNAHRKELAAWQSMGNVITPYVVPPPTTEDNRQAALKADPAYIDLLNRAKAATPAEIDAWFAANVTTLPQARGVLAAIVKYIATRL